MEGILSYIYTCFNVITCVITPKNKNKNGVPVRLTVVVYHVAKH